MLCSMLGSAPRLRNLDLTGVGPVLMQELVNLQV